MTGSQSPDLGQTPAHPSDVRLGNEWRILEVVRGVESISRGEVAAATGLTLTTVHRLMADLAGRRLLVTERANGRTGTGRPPSIFRFNAEVGWVAGVDVGNETTRAVLADLRGRIVNRAVRRTDELQADLAGGLAALVADLRGDSAYRQAPLLGVAVGVPGVTEVAEGRIVRASLHRPWDGLPLGSHLRRWLGVDVVVAQDDHLAALAEFRMGACAGLRHALVINVGKGIGAGIVADGQLHYGAHSAAGRLGWIPVPMTLPGDGGAGSSEIAAPADALGMPRASQVLTADGLIAVYRRFGGTRDAAGALDVFLADRDGDEAARRAIDLFADWLGWLIGSIVSFIDPQRVVIGGGIGESFERLRPAIEARVAEIVAVPPPIVPSTLGLDAGVRGAVVAALDLTDEWFLAQISH